MFYNLSPKSCAVLATLGYRAVPAVVLASPSHARERKILTAEQKQRVIGTPCEPEVAIATLEFERDTNTYFLFFNNQATIVNVNFITE